MSQTPYLVHRTTPAPKASTAVVLAFVRKPAYATAVSCEEKGNTQTGNRFINHISIAVVVSSLLLFITGRTAFASNICNWFSVSPTDETTHSIIAAFPILLTAACVATLFTIAYLRLNREQEPDAPINF